MGVEMWNGPTTETHTGFDLGGGRARTRTIQWLPPRSPRAARNRLAKSLFSLPYFVLRIQLDLIFARALFPPIDGPELKCVNMCEIRILIHSRNPRSDHLNGTIGHQNRHSQQKLCNILPLWTRLRPQV